MSPFDAQITFCYTERAAETYRFYEQVLELSLVLDQGGCRIYRVAEEGYLGFCDRPNVERPGGVILTLVTEDVDGWYEKLRSRGVEPEGPPRENAEYGIRHFFFRDMNGYRIEIQRFLDPLRSADR